MAEAIVSAIRKLQSLLAEMAAVGEKERAQAVIDELKYMLPLLNIFELRVHESNNKARDIVARFRDTAHDADITTDTFIFNLHESRRRRRGPTRPFVIGKQVNPHINLCRAFDRIIRDIGEASRPCSDIMLRQGEADKRTINRVLHPRIRGSKFVGLKKSVELLLPRVLTERGLSTTCIVGMGGIGKTTLAAQLYYNHHVASEFHLRAWLCLSTPRSSLREKLMKLMRGLGINREVMMKVLNKKDGLQNLLRRYLQGKRYFVVLDDVWRDSHIEFFISCFPAHDTPSRLLLTSRSRDIIGNAQYIHEMNILDPKESWQLFLKTVFKDGRTKCPSHLVDIGKKILTKCNGLPLAIREVGTQLSGKDHSESEWEAFIETMDLSVVLASLELSYHKLPQQVKSCFMRLGFFKESATIRVEKLIQIWAAGGLLVSQEEEESDTIEGIGRKCLNELISDCMVEVKDMSARDDRVKTCYMNVNLNKLAVKKAEEEIRFEVITHDDGKCRPFSRRHCVIYCGRENMNYPTHQDEHLLSLLFRGGGSFDAVPSHWKRFSLLKILDFEDFALKALPAAVGDLISLEYLGLRNSSIQELPRLVGRLKKLEVLDIALNFMVIVPDNVWKIDSLRHLYMSDAICGKPFKINTLKNIQTLTYISIDDWTYEIQIVDTLRKLGIQNLDETSDVRNLFVSLSKMKNLDCLSLRGSRFSMPSLEGIGQLNSLTQLKLYGLLTKLPSEDNFPPNIRYLTLVNTSLDKDPMLVLAKLPKLAFLKLRNAYTGKEMIASDFMFAELKVLYIGELWHLANLKVGEGAMRKLEQIEINNCPYLQTLPQEMELMKNLKKLMMVTTKGIASKIFGLGFIARLRGDMKIQIEP